MARAHKTHFWLQLFAAIFLFVRVLHSTDFDPAQIGKWPAYSRGAIKNFAISGDFAFGVMEFEGLIVLDISNPAVPERVGGCDTPGVAKDVAAKGNILFVADGWRSRTEEDPAAGLVLIDVTDKSDPRIVRNFASLDARALLLVGDVLYVVAGARLHILDVTRPLDPEPLGDCGINGPAGFWRHPKLALRDNILCIANNEAGLEVIDVSDPAAPRRLNTFDTPFDANAVALLGNHAYVADNEGGIRILDLSIPASPQAAGHIPIAGWTVSLAVYDRFLIAGNSSDGLVIFDLQNPIAPTLRTETKSNLPNDLLAIGPLLYSAEDYSGFSIYDLSVAPELTRLGEFEMSAYSYDVKIVGDHAFVADSARLEIIDIQNPRSMASVGRWRSPDYLMSVDVRGDYAFVGGDSGVTVLSIARLDQPSFIADLAVGGSAWRVVLAASFLLVEVNAYPAPSFLVALDVAKPRTPTRLDWPALVNFDRVVEVAGRYVYLSSSRANKLAVVDLEATPPAIVGIYEEPGEPNSPWRGVRLGNFLYVNERAFDVSDPTMPRLAGRFPSSPWQIVTDGEYLYGAASEFFHKYELTDPAAPRLIGVSKRLSSDLFSSVGVKGTTAFCVSPQGLHAFDTTKPANPQRAAALPRRTFQCFVQGNLAYVAENALTIFDISDPAQPRELARTGAGFTSLALNGSIAYAAGDAPQGIKVFDVSVPSTPRVIKTLRSGLYVSSLAISGAKLFAAGDGLHVFDISQPADPVEVGAFQTESISEITVSDQRAYTIGFYSGRFEILDLSNPNDIRVLFQFAGGGYGAGGYATAAAISGNHLFLAHAEYHNRNWLITLDVTDPAQPIVVGRIPIYHSRTMTVDGNLLYNSGDGLEVFDISDPANVKLVGRNGNVSAQDIHRGGDWVYLSSYDGWHILHAFAEVQGGALRFQNAAISPPATLAAHLIGVPGIDVQVEHSSDLQNWESLTAFKLPRQGQGLSPPLSPVANTFLRARIR